MVQVKTLKANYLNPRNFTDLLLKSIGVSAREKSSEVYLIVIYYGVFG